MNKTALLILRMSLTFPEGRHLNTCSSHLYIHAFALMLIYIKCSLKHDSSNGMININRHITRRLHVAKHQSNKNIIIPWTFNLLPTFATLHQVGMDIRTDESPAQTLKKLTHKFTLWIVTKLRGVIYFCMCVKFKARGGSYLLGVTHINSREQSHDSMNSCQSRLTEQTLMFLSTGLYLHE